MSGKDSYSPIPADPSASGQSRAGLPDDPQDTDTLLGDSPSSGHSPFSRENIEHHLRRARALINRHAVVFFTVGVLLVLLASVALFAAAPGDRPVPRAPFLAPLPVGISVDAFEDGLRKCEEIRDKRRYPNVNETRERNPRAVEGTKPVLLRNAVVWDGVGGVLKGVDVLLRNGIVENIAKGIKVSKEEDIKIIDVKRHIVTPGLVDMHSHIGLWSWPRYEGNADGNEFSSPLTPYVRSLESFNPSDNAIRIAASGGVTTALVLPGSSNIMGGEAYAFKLRPVQTLSADDMLVQAGLTNKEESKWRWMKMACGENPKVRLLLLFMGMGEGYLFRKQFEQARFLLRAQDDWCSAANNVVAVNKARKEANANKKASATAPASEVRLDTRFPEDIDNEALVALLRGDVRLNVHCYETYDIEAIVRHSIEFNFTISAFHHALDAYRIPAILRRARGNVTIATFADSWGYKKEAYQGSPHAPKFLVDAGIPVAFKSDHPVMNSQHLIFEAAKSAYYGLTSQQAFAAVTSVPAKAIGLSHRIGRLAPGYDADVVIWERDPLELGAHPLQVFVDGIALFDETVINEVPEEKGDKKRKEAKVEVMKKDEDVQMGETFVLRNVGKAFVRREGVVIAEERIGGELVIVVENGKVVCVGDRACAGRGRGTEYDVKGGHVLPLFHSSKSVRVSSHPPSTFSPSSPHPTLGPHRRRFAPRTRRDPSRAQHHRRHRPGLSLGRPRRPHPRCRWTQARHAPPRGSIQGRRTYRYHGARYTWCHRGGERRVQNWGRVDIVTPQAALHLHFGDLHKNHHTPTISSQLSLLRRILRTNSTDPADINPYAAAARGEIPVVITTHNRDEIASLIRLKRELGGRPNIIILGGAEAHLVASHLAAAEIPVILNPPLCTPSTFDTQRCLPGRPLSNLTAVHVLHQAGVLIGLGVADDGLTRNLAWDAGLAYQSGLGLISEPDAVALVTSNIEKIFGLEGKMSVGALAPGTEADFVVYSGSPFEMASRVVLISGGGKGLRVVV
ncbi:hypothetical protein BC936DRAFT_144004 [Jimgerdemannia flammicorona]|uniref:Amidohydrolase-related domain-containing protein n=1 Tax=Jimgerdemannia flammicorona TaxID=994334 RepID=A0A433DD70_9FUNG|nr:hypothetical protein BC936DRAFT_144004 [Jimgerdemannia flammicorona]